MNISIFTKIVPFLFLFTLSSFIINAQCTQDSIPPTLEIHKGLITVDMSKSGCIEIWAKDFVLSVSDNCTEDKDLLSTAKVRILNPSNEFASGITICCSDLCESNTIIFELQVTDKAGNTSETPTAYILFLNGDSLCDPCEPTPFIGYRLTYFNGEKIMEMYTSFQSEEPILLGKKVDSTHIEIKPILNKIDRPTTLDAITIINYILGKKNISFPLLQNKFEKISCDVNFDGYIDVLDVIEIRRVILTGKNFDPAWLFFDPNLDPDSQNLTQNIILKVSQNFTDTLDSNFKPFNLDKALNLTSPFLKFIGVPMGRPTKNGSLVGNIQDESRNNSTLIQLENQILIPNQVYSINMDLTDKNSLIGLQAQLQFDLDKIDILEVKSNKNCEFFQNIDKISLSWLDLEQTSKNFNLITLKIRAKVDISLNEVIQLDERTYQNMAVTSEATTTNVKLEFSNSVVSHFKDFSPNPFTNSTFIQLKMNAKEIVNLNVFNHLGQIVLQKNILLNKGVNSIELSKSDLPSKGIYFYKMNTKNLKKSGKIILQ